MFGKTGGLVLAGLAAYAFYKYNKMSETQKKEVVGNIKAKGQKLYDEYVPEDVKKVFGKKREEPMGGAPYGEAPYTV